VRISCKQQFSKYLEEFIMFTKRMMSLTLAALTTAALAAPAFAAETQTNTGSTPANTTEITTSYKTIEIKVTVPKTGTAQINPYGLPIEFTDSNDKTYKITSKQITTAPMAITNDGDVALTVGATATTKLSSDKSKVNFVTKANSKSTTKDVLAQLQLVQAPEKVAGDPDGINDLVIEACTTEANWENASSLTLVTTEGGATNASMATLAASTLSDGELDKYGAGSVVLVRLTGSVTESPAEPWSEDDGFITTVTYTFKPAAVETTEEA
jgi:hypothetical protein